MPVKKAGKDDVTAGLYLQVDADPHLADGSTQAQIDAERQRLRASLDPDQLAKAGLPPPTAVIDGGGTSMLPEQRLGWSHP